MTSRRRPGCQVSSGLALIMTACGLVMQSSGAPGSCGLGIRAASSARIGERGCRACACSMLSRCQCSACAASAKSSSRQRLAAAHALEALHHLPFLLEVMASCQGSHMLAAMPGAMLCRS